MTHQVWLLKIHSDGDGFDPCTNDLIEVIEVFAYESDAKKASAELDELFALLKQQIPRPKIVDWRDFKFDSETYYDAWTSVSGPFIIKYGD